MAGGKPLEAAWFCETSGGPWFPDIIVSSIRKVSILRVSGGMRHAAELGRVEAGKAWSAVGNRRFGGGVRWRGTACSRGSGGWPWAVFAGKKGSGWGRKAGCALHAGRIAAIEGASGGPAGVFSRLVRALFDQVRAFSGPVGAFPRWARALCGLLGSDLVTDWL